MPDLVIFDCDGVLIESEYLAARIESEVLTASGFPYTPHQVTARFSGVSVERMLERIAEDFGRPLTAAVIEEMTRRVAKAWDTLLEPVAHVSEAVLAISRPKCVASSTGFARLEKNLVQVGLHAHFAPHIFSAEMVDRGKPEPDLFLHAARVLGARPSRTIVIEDSLPGVEAGCAAGMTVLGFAGARHCPPDHAAALIAAGAHDGFFNMRELPDRIAEIAPHLGTDR